jgi:ISXO2-like transposase domain
VSTKITLDSGFVLIKRGLHGVYHHASVKHLHRYVDEFTFRLNEGNVAIHTLTRLDSLIAAVTGKRITYAEVIA